MTPVQQFRAFIVRPVLTSLDLHSKAAEDLVVGTAVHESGNLRFFEQLTGRDDHTLGPAIGFFQIEPATHTDVFVNFLQYKHSLLAKVRGFAADKPADTLQLMNPFYGAAICRIIYYRRPEPLPDAGDIDGYAAYWKAHYNTPRGKGTPAQWAMSYRANCGD